jgi:DNA anti-recombination protein RmuC
MVSSSSQPDQETPMTDAHLERIEAKLDRVIATQTGHTATLSQHTATLDQHTAKLEEHSQCFDQLDRRLRSVEVTLETTVPQSIKQIAEGHAMLQQQMDGGFAEIKEHIDQRLGPFEEAVRQHSAKLAGLT